MQGTTTRRCAQCGVVREDRFFIHRGEWVDKKCLACRYGRDPARMVPGKDAETLEQRLKRNLRIDPETGCWLWQGAVGGDGYGRLRFQKVDYRAHRAAWLVWRREEIPADLQVCHTCDRPLCCCPAHLWLGTPSDNMRDCVSKGRKPYPVNNIAEYWRGKSRTAWNKEHGWGWRKDASSRSRNGGKFVKLKDEDK